jgi:hypothetical protein
MSSGWRSCKGRLDLVRKATSLRRLSSLSLSLPTTHTMKSSRRSRLASNGSTKRPKPAPVSPPKPRPESESSPTHLPVSEPQAQTLSAGARYQRNLKSLRRIDPTIVSIIDQFSHICLYRLHDGKWQKDGFEGASFLFERCAFSAVITTPPLSHFPI